MNLKYIIAFLEQRRDLLETQLDLTRYRNHDPNYLASRVDECSHILNKVKDFNKN